MKRAVPLKICQQPAQEKKKKSVSQIEGGCTLYPDITSFIGHNIFFSNKSQSFEPKRI